MKYGLRSKDFILTGCLRLADDGFGNGCLIITSVIIKNVCRGFNCQQEKKKKRTQKTSRCVQSDYPETSDLKLCKKKGDKEGPKHTLRHRLRESQLFLPGYDDAALRLQCLNHFGPEESLFGLTSCILQCHSSTTVTDITHIRHDMLAGAFAVLSSIRFKTELPTHGGQRPRTAKC